MKAIEKIVRSLYGIGNIFNQAYLVGFYIDHYPIETGVIKYLPNTNYKYNFEPVGVSKAYTNGDPWYTENGIIIEDDKLYVSVGVDNHYVELVYDMKSGELVYIHPDEYVIPYEGWMAFYPWRGKNNTNSRVKMIRSFSNYFLKMPKRVFKNIRYYIDKYNDNEF